jgi:predicted phage-related endonuclease
MIAAVRTLAALSASRKSYEGGEEGVGLMIREYMKEKVALVVDGEEIATLRAQNTQSIDSAKLKAEFPDAFKACRKIGTTRVLRLKEKAL